MLLCTAYALAGALVEYVVKWCFDIATTCTSCGYICCSYVFTIYVHRMIMGLSKQCNESYL